MRVEGIQSARIPAEMSNIWPFLENFAARSHERLTAKGLLDACLARDKQVWKIGDWQGLCLTSVGQNEVNIEACAGIRRHEWQADLADEIEAWARALGKKRVFAKTRPGWAKFGKTRGYKEIHREFMIEV